MKALFKILWFAAVIFLLNRFGANIFNEDLNNISDQMLSFLPEFLANLDFVKNLITSIVSLEKIKQIAFTLVLFLGLDIISGDIKGIIMGPIKLVLNAILYTIGFIVIFFLIDGFRIIF
ncbi:MAG: hypothetical protein GX490_09805 [Bacilli bacterium]|nr:hypothetical protein [Bacilli bacterium]